jgi:hypothetical protein
MGLPLQKTTSAVFPSERLAKLRPRTVPFGLVQEHACEVLLALNHVIVHRPRPLVRMIKHLLVFCATVVRCTLLVRTGVSRKL